MEELKKKCLEKVARMVDVNGIASLCNWDQHTYMPENSIESKIRHLTFLQSYYHELMSSTEFGDMIDQLSSYQMDNLRWQALLKVIKRERKRLIRLPKELVERIAQAEAEGVESWKRARLQNDFSIFKPSLSKLVLLKQEEAKAVNELPGYYDNLLDFYEPGCRAKDLFSFFTQLKGVIIDLLSKIEKSRLKPTWKISDGHYPAFKQEQMVRYFLERMGYDFKRGRIDKSAHPFTTSFGHDDVRITIRIDERDFTSALYSAIHEGGHALYNQGFSEEDKLTPLSDSPSYGMHESQSRFWENIIARSLPFWKCHFNYINDLFRDELIDVELLDFYEAINRVSRSIIRVEADEVTYNLHIVLRLELEYRLIENEITVDDLENLMAEKMEEYIGIRPKYVKDGVLQDIHWASGMFGYFPTYTLGNIYSADILSKFERDFPDFWQRIENGDLIFVRKWLREKIHSQGKIYNANELIERVTGKKSDIGNFTNYLLKKYGDIYGFNK